MSIFVDRNRTLPKPKKGIGTQLRGKTFYQFRTPDGSLVQLPAEALKQNIEAAKQQAENPPTETK